MSLPSKELSDDALDTLIVRERARMGVPLTEWHVLAEQLRAEGMIQGEERRTHPSFGETSTVHQRSRGRVMRWGTQFVASMALLGVGVVIGRGMTLGHEIAPIIKQAITESAIDSAADFRSATQARAALVRSQSQYQRASAYLAAHDTSAQVVMGPEVYQERLAALDEMVAATRTKLQSVPGDPVLNQYYQSAIGAREATIQQLGRTLPAGARLAHY